MAPIEEIREALLRKKAAIEDALEKLEEIQLLVDCESPIGSFSSATTNLKDSGECADSSQSIASSTRPLPTIREGVIALLRERGEVMKTREISEALEGEVSTKADNFQGAVAATLSNLVKAGKISKASGGGYSHKYSPI